MAMAVTCGIAALVLIVLGDEAPAQEEDAGGVRQGVPGIQDHGVPRSTLEREGEELFRNSCSSCHGFDARGIPGRAPSLRGVGEVSADFYLRTGRMPLDDPEDQPRRAESPFSERQIDALIAYVGSFGGPGIPSVDPARGDLSEGQKLFAEKCMGCHQVLAQGGMTTRAWVPDLQESNAIDVAEAVEVAPYVMPHFVLSEDQVNSIARYVDYTKDPEDRGGWGIGHIGPIPEGMVTWLLAAVMLVLVIRLIGERTTDEL
jgi:ubiquinol-cytochrome c reductase cytochrome c subunit